MKTFYIADTHFGHANILSFDNRPFKTVEEMDGELVRRWNEHVAAEDTIYILGDLSWYGMEKTIEIVKSLNGKKVFIKGNHDSCNDGRFKNCFVNFVDYLEIKDDGRNVVLCHYPIPTFKNHFYGWYHLYGHVHVSFENNMIERFKYEMTSLYDKECRMFNVGAMMPRMDYTPKTLNEIISWG